MNNQEFVIESFINFCDRMMIAEESMRHDGDIKYIDIKDPESKKYLLKDSYCKRLMNYITSCNDGEIVVDTDKDILIGRVLVRNDKKNKGFINAFYVDEKYRKRGIGNTLLNDAINKYHGYDLLVDKNNKIAISIYKKYGFVIDENMSDETGYYMILKSHFRKK